MAGHDEPDWLRLQKTIFSRYVEQRLKDGGITKKITNLVEEMKSGELLLQLLEVMSGVSSGKKTKDTKLRIQQIQNVNDAIDFAKKVGVDFTKIRISAEDFVDGKEQSVLAAVFQIIIRFLKFDEEEDAKTGGGGIDVREALMLWLKNKTAGYNGVNIKDFTKSFHDGLPFLALIHKLRPRLVEYDTCVGRSAKVNVEEALSLGEKYLNIPQYITADDLPKLNEISMLVYLTDWYAGVVLLQKQDIAAARIGKLEDITELHDKLRANYLERAKALSSWVTSTIAAQADRTIDDTMAGAKARLEEFQTYKKVAKTEQIGLKLDALALYDNLAARLVNHKRPPFLPKGLIPSDLDHAFVELEKSEVARSQYLNAELNRQIQLAKLYRRFQGNASKLSAYASDKDAQIKALSSASSQDALDSLDSLDVIQIEVTQTVSGPLVELNKVGDNLVAERFEHKGDVTATQSSINANLKAVQDLIASLRHQLYEKLFHWYTSHAEGLVSWIQSTISTQADRTIDNSMAGVKARLEEFETYKKAAKAEHLQSYEDAKSLYENISSRLANHGKPAFTPAGLVPTDLAHHFQQLDQSEAARSTYLHAELARQIQLAKLYRQFQGNTAKLGQWLKEKEGPLKTPLNINSVEDAESEIDAIDILSGELNNVTSGPLTDLQKLAHRLVSEHFEEHKSVSSIESDITHQFEQVQAEVKTKNAQANAQLQEQKAINERLYQAFASAVNALQSFVQTKRDALAAEEKHEPEQQLTVVEGLVADAQAATSGLVGAIESADRDLQARELVNNPYTNVSTGDAISTLTSFTVLIQKKVALLKEQIDEKKRGGLSPEQIAEIHANFAYFDKDSNGFLNKKELRTCLQSLGEESTPQSINVILEKYDSGKKGTLTKAEFEIFIRESLGDTGTSEEIIKSFRLLTYDAATFTEQNLVNVVNNRTFTDHHVTYLKQEVKQTEPGHYDYATWTAEAFAR